MNLQEGDDTINNPTPAASHTPNVTTPASSHLPMPRLEIRETQRRTISPYDISTGDNSATVISQPLLRGHNYDEWATNFRQALIARKKFGFVDGSIPLPTIESGDQEDWITINALIVSWMKLTIEPVVRSNLVNHETAQEMWEQIKRRYSVKNGQRMQRLKAELVMTTQRGMSIETYFGKLTNLWSAIADHRQGKTLADVAREREEDKVHEFLMGLDEATYGTVKSSILSRQPIPDLDEVYQILLQDEDAKKAAKVMETRQDNMAFSIQTSPQSQSVKEEQGRVVCTTCGKRGHLSGVCYKNVGYPPWWGEKSAGRGRGRGRGSSSGVRNSNYQTTAHNIITDNDRTGLSGLSDSQWRTLVSLLNEKKDHSNQSNPRGMYSDTSWIIDTGATNHMTGSLSQLSDLHDILPVSVKLPNGSTVFSTKMGMVRLSNTLTLHHVLLVGGLQCHLISVSQLNRDSLCLFQITDKLCVIQDRITKTLIGAGEQQNGLYFFKKIESGAYLNKVEISSSELWHRRFGHPSKSVLESLSISGISVETNKLCDVCTRAKQTRESFPTSSNKTTRLFELVHMDLWGPYRTTSHCGSSYFLTIVDDLSRGVWIYLLSHKTEVGSILKRFISLVERQFDTRIKCFRSDNGTEFMALTSFFRDNGIAHETSCVGTPQQNGRVERKHRHILNVARALRFQSHLPIEYWSECILTAAYLINRTPTPVLQGKTPFEMLYNRPPPLQHFRTFGCLCYAHNQSTHGDKFASRSRKCVFIGYPNGRKGWKVLDAETGRIIVSRDVVFAETEFPYDNGTTVASTGLETDEADDSSPIIGPNDRSLTPQAVQHDTQEHKLATPEDIPVASQHEEEETVDSNSELSSQDALRPESSGIPLETDPPSPDSEDREGPSTIDRPLRRSERTKTAPTYLNDYVVHTVTTDELLSSTAQYPITDYVNCLRFSDNHTQFLLAVTKGVEPQSYHKAVEDPKWQEAVRAEIEALEENGTWTIEELPPDKIALGCQWVFKLKYKADGELARHKARLVAQGNNQKEGVDYTETFAPVAKMTTVRTFLQIAASKDWEVHQMDVHNAFLHGDLHEEVYMKLPPGFRAPSPRHVCRLHKSLYGLRQAPRCWFEKLRQAMDKYGFKQSISDYSLFSYHQGAHSLHVLVYVDDLIIMGSTPSLVAEFKGFLSSCFHMKDLGILKYFLGIEVARNPQGIYLCQRAYTLDILAETGLLASRPAATPLEQNHRLSLATGPLLKDPAKYRRLIGRLIYLGNTRPDISYSVHVLAQFMQAPREEHWDAALRVVRYLKSHPGQGIFLNALAPLRLIAWCDSDWAGCQATRRSQSGWIVKLGGSPISWKSQKQHVVSRSSAEAEYRSMAQATCELIWLKALLHTFGVHIVDPIPLFCDNSAAIHLAANPVFHERTKHIEVDCHFVRDEVQKGTIQTVHVNTKDQLADCFTKALGKVDFTTFIGKLGVRDLHSPA